MPEMRNDEHGSAGRRAARRGNCRAIELPVIIERGGTRGASGTPPIGRVEKVRISGRLGSCPQPICAFSPMPPFARRAISSR